MTAQQDAPVTTRPKGDAPAGWEWVDLTRVARLESGHTPSRRVAAYWEGGTVAWLSLKDIRGLNGKYVYETADQPTALGIANSSARVLPKGTVALCRTASVGNAVILGREMATSQDFVNWVCSEKLFPEYLYWSFKASASTFELEKQGSTHQTIYMPTVERFQLLLPPPAEQRRIAEILDRADALRVQRRAAIAELDSLPQAIFLDMFGDPVTNPKGWPIGTMGSLAAKFSDGPFGSNLKSSHYEESGVRVVRLQNIGCGEFRDEDRAFISEDHYGSLGKHECLPGDVLVATLGDPNLRACVQPPWLEIAINKADCVQIRAAESKATPQFICALLNQPGTVQLAQAVVRGQTRPRISMGRLRELEVPIPPLKLQRELKAKVQAVEKLKTTQKAALAELDALFASLQHRAFRGEL